MDNLEVLDNGTFLVSSSSTLYIRLGISNTISGDDKTALLELNSQGDIVDFYHDQIVITSGNYSYSGSSGYSQQAIEELKQELLVSLDSYLLKQVFYDYIENRSLLEEYIKYVEERDFLYTEKTFVTERGFVMFFDDDTYSEGGGDSSGDGSGSTEGTLDHSELTNRDALYQHPIDSITGLREIIDKLENGEFLAQTTISWDDIEDKPEVYHTENANLFSIDWKAKDVFASGQVVMYTTSSIEGGDAESGAGTFYHDQLLNLDLANQHPISAIIDLESILEGKADINNILWANLQNIPEWITETKPTYTWDEVTEKPDVYHSENANLLTIDWKARILYTAQTVVMFSDGDEIEDDEGDNESSGGTLLHDELQNLDVENQHPIAAIIDLQTALDSAAISAVWSNIEDVPTWIGSSKPDYSWSEIASKPSWIDSFDPDTKLDVAGGTITGDLRLKGSGNYGNKLSFGDNNFVYLYESSDDCLDIKGTTINLLGSVNISNLNLVSGGVKIDGVDLEIGQLTYFDNGSDNEIKIVVGDVTKSFEVGYSATSGFSATSSALSTARTLWGCLFDGTENISGDLIDVVNIEMSGKLDVSSISDDSIKTCGGVVMYST
ncbi:MAG: hypothetical protein R3Y50_05255 [Rikenellaceae bacterium]